MKLVPCSMEFNVESYVANCLLSNNNTLTIFAGSEIAMGIISSVSTHLPDLLHV